MGIALKDLVGKQFGRLTVIAKAPSRTKQNGQRQSFWLCRCECGQEKEFPNSNLQSGNTRSCGCLRRRPAHNRLDLTGQTFGKITVLHEAERQLISGIRFTRWHCRCECGTETDVLTSNLTSGTTKTCGCSRLDPERIRAVAEANTKHGHTPTTSPTYRSWMSMRRRCVSRTGYVDRGITVDPRWDSFVNFLADMGERPDDHTLDRIDNDGPYSPSNCRWATGKTQGNNRRNNRSVTYQGHTQTIAEWAREVGIKHNTLYNRIVLYNWPLVRAMKP